MVTFGALGDSFYEYLIKVWIQTGRKDDRLRKVMREIKKFYHLSSHLPSHLPSYLPSHLPSHLPPSHLNFTFNRCMMIVWMG